MDKISVLIPTYNSPESLDLLLKSLIEGAFSKTKHQIIVGVDGTYNINKPTLDKYKDNVELLILDENVGLCRMTNLLVCNAYNDLILILNDDNVAPNNWDACLLQSKPNNSVISPNQIEPTPSMFKQFYHFDLGKNVVDFDLEKFNKIEHEVSTVRTDETGSTLPIFMKKIDFLRVGGWDENYPEGMVADWDFFLKCQLSGLKMIRTYNCHFYHFVSLSVNNEKRRIAEEQGHYFSQYKWGTNIKHNIDTNLKYI
jgi:O-antigen biosynthesis protein